ncbi:hypothetical protein HK105_208993 [Polyrhizophydium stewartii]|uniref:Uncharacterized protein n=1 Tax=Polyrhizophydium stewartii TaxID=2732419 RepID=A0ABR4MWD0_9FUNG
MSMYLGFAVLPADDRSGFSAAMRSTARDLDLEAGGAPFGRGLSGDGLSATSIDGAPKALRSPHAVLPTTAHTPGSPRMGANESTLANPLRRVAAAATRCLPVDEVADKPGLVGGVGSQHRRLHASETPDSTSAVLCDKGVAPIVCPIPIKAISIQLLESNIAAPAVEELYRPACTSADFEHHAGQNSRFAHAVIHSDSNLPHACDVPRPRCPDRQRSSAANNSHGSRHLSQTEPLESDLVYAVDDLYATPPSQPSTPYTMPRGVIVHVPSRESGGTLSPDSAYSFALSYRSASPSSRTSVESCQSSWLSALEAQPESRCSRRATPAAHDAMGQDFVCEVVCNSREPSFLLDPSLAVRKRVRSD